jgi:hypothetical protein
MILLPTPPSLSRGVAPTNVLLLADDEGAVVTPACGDDEDDDVVEEEDVIVNVNTISTPCLSL